MSSYWAQQPWAEKEEARRKSFHFSFFRLEPNERVLTVPWVVNTIYSNGLSHRKSSRASRARQSFGKSPLHVQWNQPSPEHTCLFISRSIFSQKKSETSSEDISVRAVCLDGSLSAPRSRTWRTWFYILLVISQPEPNI